MYSILSSSDFRSALGTSPSATGRACDSCRKLKIRCRKVKRTFTSGSSSRATEPCDQCRRSGLKCTYEERPVKRGRRMKKDSLTSPDLDRYSGLVLDLDSTPWSELGVGVVSQDQVALPSCERPVLINQPVILTDDDLPLGSDFAEEAHDYDTMRPEHDNPRYNPQIPGTGTRFADNNISLITEGMLQSVDVDASRSDEIWNVVDHFFDTMYVVFPVLSYAKLASRLIIEPAWNTVPDLRTLLLGIKLVNAASQFRMAPENQTPLPLSDLIKQVEASRLDYEFADPPTLDAVVVSLFLFTAYNVLEKHNRAFLYLDEALSLVEAVGAEQPADEEEQHRKLQIEQVLFNTEAATIAIYADKNRRPRARKPLRIAKGPGLGSVSVPQNIIGGNESGGMAMATMVESDRVAMHLLRRLTEIHLAENAEALEGVDIDFEADDNANADADMATLFWAVFNRHRYSRIQAADVVVTRQWQLSSKLAASLSLSRAGDSRRFQESIELLGVTAMSWICLLGEGELRIVGLGKLCGLAQNIHALALTLAGGDTTTGGRYQHQYQYQYILGGLAGAVIKEDHERIFAPRLADVVMPMMVATIPAPMSISMAMPMREYELWNSNTVSRADTVTATATAIESAGVAALEIHGWESTRTMPDEAKRLDGHYDMEDQVD